MVSALASGVSILELTGMSCWTKGEAFRGFPQKPPLYPPHYQYLPHKPNTVTSAKVCVGKEPWEGLLLIQAENSRARDTNSCRKFADMTQRGNDITRVTLGCGVTLAFSLYYTGYEGWGCQRGWKGFSFITFPYWERSFRCSRKSSHKGNLRKRVKTAFTEQYAVSNHETCVCQDKCIFLKKSEGQTTWSTKKW